MSSYMPNPQTVERKWYIIDAQGKPRRVAAQAATLSEVNISPHSHLIAIAATMSSLSTVKKRFLPETSFKTRNSDGIRAGSAA